MIRFELRRRGLPRLAAVAALSAAASLCGIFAPGARAQSPAGAAPGSAADPQNFGLIEKGRYLAVVGDCVSCHTAPGGKPFAGGLPMQTPFGAMLTPNITPDRETGAGKMTDAEFASALREGRGQGGKRLYPAMPYPSYTILTDEDVRALRAYFASLPAVRNEVKVNQLKFPFSIREDAAVWNFLEFHPGRYKPDPAKGEVWNRGAYLVEGLGHCGVCHTPKNLMFGDVASRRFEGAVIDGWFAPNISNSRRFGVGEWSEDQIVAYLKTGANDRALASAGMGQVVRNSTSQMTEGDLRAIAAYLKSIEPRNERAVQALSADAPAMRAGGAVYKDNCAACHLDSGQGAPGLFPRLAGSSNVRSVDATTLGRKVLEGSRAAGTDAAPTAPAMPAFGWRLNDQQAADVLTYIRNAWGNAADPVEAGTIAALRKRAARD